MISLKTFEVVCSRSWFDHVHGHAQCNNHHDPLQSGEPAPNLNAVFVKPSALTSITLRTKVLEQNHRFRRSSHSERKPAEALQGLLDPFTTASDAGQTQARRQFKRSKPISSSAPAWAARPGTPRWCPVLRQHRATASISLNQLKPRTAGLWE